MPRIVDHEQQRRALAATAADVVAMAGLEQTTLREVASRHGCTKGMVQHYFADKEALLCAALEWVDNSCETRLLCLANSLSGLSLLEARLRGMLPLDRQRQREWQVRLAFNNPQVLSPTLSRSVLRRHSQQKEAGLRLLREARARGELRQDVSPLSACRSLLSLVHGMSMTAVVNPSELPYAAQRKILKSSIDDLRP